MNLSGIRPDQGPPLSIPLSFFVTAALAVAAAGGWLIVSGGAGLHTLWSPQALAVVHLGTVGLLLFAMVGALYQMLPVVAGAAVAWPRLGHLTHALLAVGTVALLMGQATSSPGAFRLALYTLAPALLLFWIPAAVALSRTAPWTPVVNGIRLAMLGLLAVALVGLHLAHARGGGGLPNSWVAWRFAHAHLGILCWVGALVGSISWQVLPMFHLVPEVPRWAQRAFVAGVAASLVGLLAVYALGLPQGAVGWAALPGALAVWLLNPALLGRGMLKRRRRRRDPTLWYWWLSVGAAPVCLLLAAGTLLLEPPQIPIAYGVVILWGWAGARVHGMLTRIVPFLVWFHRCAPRLGRGGKMPNMRELYPDPASALGFWLHLGSLALGLLAAAAQRPLLWAAFGVGLLATAAHLCVRVAVALARSAAQPLPTDQGATKSTTLRT